MDMKINFKATNMELTEAVKQYAEEKITKLTKYIPDQPDIEVKAQVELGKEVGDQRAGDIFLAELNMEVSGQFYRAAAEKDDLYAAIDQMRDEAARVLKKDKGRKNSLYRQGGSKIKNFLKGLGNRS